MSGSPARKTPRTYEDDLFSAETKRIPADVVKAVIKASEERATLPPPPGSEVARLTAPQRHPPSGTRRRVSADEIAQFIATRNAPPILDSYAPERVEEILEVRDCDLLPDPQPEPEPAPPPAAPRKRVPLAPIPLAVFPRGAYPAPRIEEPPQPIVEQPLAVFLLAMGAVILVLMPLVYVLLR